MANLISRKEVLKRLGSLAVGLPLVTSSVPDLFQSAPGSYEQVRTDRISLKGTWRFALDEANKGKSNSYFNIKLQDSIILPGSVDDARKVHNNVPPDIMRLYRPYKYIGVAWYQRDIVIPPGWKDKQIHLFLERCHWETTVWIDDKIVGTQNSLCTPHIYNLGNLSPGKYILTIRVDNTYKIPIGTWGFSITEDTQTNWNGMIGRLELYATDPAWIQNVQVYTDHLKVRIGNQTTTPIEATLQGKKIIIPSKGDEVILPFKQTYGLWDEFTPQMHMLTLSLKSKRWSDSYKIRYGLRHLSTKDKQFIMNDRPIMMRGPVNECVYPLSGYPPMDKASWVNLLNLCKSYGLNFMRFNSWCPPEAAFEAADELGYFLQIEIPLWGGGFGQNQLLDQFIEKELNLILDTYGNHPSFCFLGMGNESPGKLYALVKEAKRKDPRHLYRCEKSPGPPDGDYYEIGLRGVVGPPTNWDRWNTFSWISDGQFDDYKNTSLPIIAHEVGQWAMYPDYNQIKKYTGVLRADNFKIFRQSLKASGMADQAQDFCEASGKFSVLLYKEEIEAGIRTWPYGGFQIVNANDFTGEGTAVIGWFDAFWDSKGIITPKEFRRFCAPTVCLIRMAKRIYTKDELFIAKAEIAHYGPGDMEAEPKWVITDEQGKEIAQGQFAAAKLKTGQLTIVGEIIASLENVSAPARLIVTISGAGTSNAWNIWVYPVAQIQIPKNIHISYTLDDATNKALLEGGKVLLFSSPKEGVIAPPDHFLPPDSVRALPSPSPGKNAIPGSFMPVFWDTRLFNQIGTLSILCNPDHPALAAFPTENHSDWQWADLLGHFSAADSYRIAGMSGKATEDLKKYSQDVFHRSKAIILDQTPPDYRPIVQMIDNCSRNTKLGLLFETKVGKGKLLICTMDLDTDIDKRPAARQLKKSLVDYVAGDDFAPSFTLSEELLRKLLTI